MTGAPAQRARRASNAASSEGAAPLKLNPDISTMVSAPLNINVFATPESVARQPTKRPPFTKESILKQLPARLFVKSTFWSMAYLLRDLVMIAALGYGATQIESAPAAWRPLLWAVYWYAQGCVMTGVWVLSHECGHQAFSPSKTVNGARVRSTLLLQRPWTNGPVSLTFPSRAPHPASADTVGWIFHSALLVPYHSWRISHKNHHSNTCSVEHDEVFAAPSHSSFAQEMMQDTPIGNLLLIARMLIFGWCVCSAFAVVHSARPPLLTPPRPPAPPASGRRTSLRMRPGPPSTPARTTATLARRRRSSATRRTSRRRLRAGGRSS
jgi:hypothetical protein